MTAPTRRGVVRTTASALLVGTAGCSGRSVTAPQPSTLCELLVVNYGDAPRSVDVVVRGAEGPIVEYSGTVAGRDAEEFWVAFDAETPITAEQLVIEARLDGGSWKELHLDDLASDEVSSIIRISEYGRLSIYYSGNCQDGN